MGGGYWNMVGNTGSKTTFLSFPNSTAHLKKWHFLFLFTQSKKLAGKTIKNAILAFALLLRNLKKRRFTPTITHHAQISRNLQTSQVKVKKIFHNNRMFEVSRVNTPCRALQNPPYSKASECLKIMSVLKSLLVTLK